MEELDKPQHQTVQTFLKRFLLHALIIWLLVNTGSWILYIYKVKLDLAYTVNKDGSLISFTESFVQHNLKQPLILWVLLVAFLAELNYRIGFRGKSLLWFIISSKCLGIAGGAVSLLFTAHNQYYPVFAQFIDSAVFIIIYLAGYAISYNFFYGRYQRIKYYQKRSESELNLLKAQINPHFLFNTLNNLYGIALTEQAARTAEGIELLADMMRYNMYGIKEDYVSLETELNFIENYLALQQLRVPQKSNITISINIPRPDPKFKYAIAPMLLIPFIENAWKYGISMEKPSYITLNLYTYNHWLVMELENSVFTNEENKTGANLGLENVRQRLQILYPGLHELTIQHNESYYRVKLKVLLNGGGPKRRHAIIP